MNIQTRLRAVFFGFFQNPRGFTTRCVFLATGFWFSGLSIEGWSQPDGLNEIKERLNLAVCVAATDIQHSLSFPFLTEVAQREGTLPETYFHFQHSNGVKESFFGSYGEGVFLPVLHLRSSDSGIVSLPVQPLSVKLNRIMEAATVGDSILSMEPYFASIKLRRYVYIQDPGQVVLLYLPSPHEDGSRSFGAHAYFRIDLNDLKVESREIHPGSLQRIYPNKRGTLIISSEGNVVPGFGAYAVAWAMRNEFRAVEIGSDRWQSMLSLTEEGQFRWVHRTDSKAGAVGGSGRAGKKRSR
jgi:hypothetical protein